MTLDRIDNTRAHLKDNVVPSCIRCNYIRGSMPYEAWMNIVPSIRQTKELGLFGTWRSRPMVDNGRARMYSVESTGKMGTAPNQTRKSGALGTRGVATRAGDSPPGGSHKLRRFDSFLPHRPTSTREGLTSKAMRVRVPPGPHWASGVIGKRTFFEERQTAKDPSLGCRTMSFTHRGNGAWAPALPEGRSRPATRADGGPPG